MDPEFLLEAGADHQHDESIFSVGIDLSASCASTTSLSGTTSTTSSAVVAGRKDFTAEADQPFLFDLQKLNTWFQELLKTKGVDIFRMKGVVCVKDVEAAGDEQRPLMNIKPTGSSKSKSSNFAVFAFHGIHMQLQTEKLVFENRKDKTGLLEKVNRMVFIGRNLDREFLTTGFKGCRWTPGINPAKLSDQTGGRKLAGGAFGFEAGSSAGNTANMMVGAVAGEDEILL